MVMTTRTDSKTDNIRRDEENGTRTKFMKKVIINEYRYCKKNRRRVNCSVVAELVVSVLRR